jgi:hypothetical protein
MRTVTKPHTSGCACVAVAVISPMLLVVLYQLWCICVAWAATPTEIRACLRTFQKRSNTISINGLTGTNLLRLSPHGIHLISGLSYQFLVQPHSFVLAALPFLFLILA